MIDSSVAKQGNTDGMCGIFCLANAVRHWEHLWRWEERTERTSLRLILEATERAGLLTAYRLIDGYAWYELVEIFNHFASRIEFPAQAISLSRGLALTNSANSGISRLRELVEAKCQVVVTVEGGQHWVLANQNNADRSVECVDPWPGSQRRQISRFGDLWEGLVLKPLVDLN